MVSKPGARVFASVPAPRRISVVGSTSSSAASTAGPSTREARDEQRRLRELEKKADRTRANLNAASALAKRKQIESAIVAKLQGRPVSSALTRVALGVHDRRASGNASAGDEDDDSSIGSHSGWDDDTDLLDPDDG